MAQRSGAVEVAELMPAYPPNWDAISQRQHPRKPCHSSDAQTGTHFPNGMPGGNRTPESRPRTGQTFRLRAVSESASRSGAIFWDELSARGSTGNGIPFWSLIPGHSFRLRAVSESASHSRRGFWDTVSASNKRPQLAMESGLKAQFMRLMASADGRAECRPRSTLPAVTSAAVRRIHHGQIWTQLAVKRAIGVLHGGRRGNRCDLADALAAICHRQ